MASVLIIGANKGLGQETARRLVLAGHTVHLDVTSDASMTAAAAALDSLDVLINNAGSAGEWETFEGSLFGMVRVLHAFLPLLQRSAAPVIVNVSSPVSKAAVNIVTVQYAKAFPRMRINAVEPGFTTTDLNAEIIVRMAQIGPDGPTGGYFDADGPLPW